MLSVVIPAYNEEDYIGKCLKSLAQQQTNEEFEVIVVDNASTDRTADISNNFKDKLNLRVIYEPKKGRGAARAAGCSAAQGDIIFWTDADATPPIDWLQELSQALHSNRNIIAVTTPLKITDCSFFGNFILNLQIILMGAYRLIWGHFWLNGFSTAIWKSVYGEAGGFDTHADAQEDTELSRRVRRIGTIKLLPHPRMPVSGRRFQKTGILRGLWEYLSSFISVRLSRGKKRADLSNVR